MPDTAEVFEIGAAMLFKRPHHTGNDSQPVVFDRELASGVLLKNLPPHIDQTNPRSGPCDIGILIVGVILSEPSKCRQGPRVGRILGVEMESHTGRDGLVIQKTV